MGRLLIVAAAQVSGPDLREAVAERVADGATDVRVIAPALTGSAIDQAMGNVDDAIAVAEECLAHSLGQVREAGVEATGEVGDSDLRLAIQDALQTFDADEILIVAHRDDPPTMERRGIGEAEHGFEAPITELFVTGGADAPRIADVERIGRGLPEGDPGEVRPGSRNLPPYSPRDLAGMLVAIVGTGVLVVLAANCPTGFAGGFDGCSARLLLAGLVGLVNLAHVVGLMLFQAGPYRGFWREFFADLSLYGTPAAIFVSAILG